MTPKRPHNPTCPIGSKGRCWWAALERQRPPLEGRLWSGRRGEKALRWYLVAKETRGPAHDQTQLCWRRSSRTEAAHHRPHRAAPAPRGPEDLLLGVHRSRQAFRKPCRRQPELVPDGHSPRQGQRLYPAGHVRRGPCARRTARRARPRGPPATPSNGAGGIVLTRSVCGQSRVTNTKSHAGTVVSGCRRRLCLFYKHTCLSNYEVFPFTKAVSEEGQSLTREPPPGLSLVV